MPAVQAGEVIVRSVTNWRICEVRCALLYMMWNAT